MNGDYWYSEQFHDDANRQPLPHYDNWHAAQQADDEARRRQAGEAWNRIKRGEYTDRDLMIIEHELRGIL